MKQKLFAESGNSPPSPLKRCTKCKKEFPATSDFFNRKCDTSDGLRNQCKVCQRAGYVAYYVNNSEAVLAQHARYRSADPERIRAIKRASMAKWRKRNPLYQIWYDMIKRCTNPQKAKYAWYGGANPPVKVCERWLNSFQAFIDDMGEHPARTTIGRFGDVGNYEPGNCAWQTDEQQKLEACIKKWNKKLDQIHQAAIAA